jgi:hypothetical protein
VREPERKRHLQRSKINKCMGCILEKKEIVWTGLNMFKAEPIEGSCEHSNEPSCSIKY